MVAWSTVTIAGKPIIELIKEKPDKYGRLDLEAMAAEGRAGGWKILGGKGSTEFGIGASIAEVTRAIFADEKRVLPVSVLLQGEYGQDDVYAFGTNCTWNQGSRRNYRIKYDRGRAGCLNASCKTLKENYQIALRL